MKKYILLSILSLMFGRLSYAQKPDMTAANQSDPEAKALLDKVRAKYEKIGTLKAGFTMHWQVPAQDPIHQKGVLIQQGDKYRISLPDQEYISDGKNLWVHLKDKEEVQINSVEEGSGALTPGGLLRIYESDDYIYILAHEYTGKKRIIQQVEFKPVDRHSEYTKMRLKIDKKTKDIVEINAFYKDGTRLNLLIDNQVSNPPLPAGIFKFDTEKYPAVRVEDLRLD